jgi:hypothetical protein
MLVLFICEKQSMWSSLREAKVRCKNRWSEAHTNKQALFRGERSFEISKKVRKRTKIRILFFKVRFKLKWRKKEKDTDEYCATLKLEKRKVYFKIKIHKLQKRESIETNLMVVDGSKWCKSKLQKENLEKNRGEIATQDFFWEKSIEAFTYFFGNKLISNYKRNLEKQKVNAVVTWPGIEFFSTSEGPLLVDRNFRESVRNSGDSSQFEVIFQSFISLISEENGYGYFIGKDVECEEANLICIIILKHHERKECNNDGEAIINTVFRIREIARKEKFDGFLVKFPKKFQYFTESRSSIELILIDFEVFQCSIFAVK